MPSALLISAAFEKSLTKKILCDVSEAIQHGHGYKKLQQRLTGRLFLSSVSHPSQNSAAKHAQKIAKPRGCIDRAAIALVGPEKPAAKIKHMAEVTKQTRACIDGAFLPYFDRGLIKKVAQPLLSQ
jgi:hypothetical protein